LPAGEVAERVGPDPGS